MGTVTEFNVSLLILIEFHLVISAPSFWSYLMEDVATAPIFGKLGNETNTMLVFFFLIFLFFGLTIGVTYVLIMLLQNRKGSGK